MTYATTHRAGIYMIRNSVTGDAYYGSAVDLRRRSQTHASALRNGRHGNARLQYSWNKHGEAAFTFAVLAVLERDDLLATESRLLAAHVGRPDCYNIAEVAAAPMAGRKHTPESLERIRAAGTGRTHSPETKAKMSAWQKGRKATESERNRLATLNVGRTRSTESRAKQGDALRASWALSDVESRTRRVAGMHSPENRVSQKGRVFTPEHRAKIAETKYLRRALRFAVGNLRMAA